MSEVPLQGAAAGSQILSMLGGGEGSPTSMRGAHPQPSTLTPKPETRNPDPETRNPDPGSRIPDPGSRNPDPGTRNSEPGTQIAKPEMSAVEVDDQPPQDDFWNGCEPRSNSRFLSLVERVPPTSRGVDRPEVYF